MGPSNSFRSQLKANCFSENRRDWCMVHNNDRLLQLDDGIDYKEHPLYNMSYLHYCTVECRPTRASKTRTLIPRFFPSPSSNPKGKHYNACFLFLRFVRCDGRGHSCGLAAVRATLTSFVHFRYVAGSIPNVTRPATI